MAAVQNSYSSYLAGDDAYSIADHADFKPTGAFTVGFWIKTTDNTKYIFQSYAAADSKNAGWIAYVQADGKAVFWSGKNTGTTINVDYQKVTSTSAINTGVWKYVVATSDGTNLKIYIDGVLEATTAWANHPAYQATNYIRVGCAGSAGGNSLFLIGNLDGVFLINGTALTQAQIATLMYQDLTGTTNLKAYYKFENNANDSSGQSHTLTDISVPVYQNTADSVPFTYYLESTDNLSSMYFTTDDAISIVNHADFRPTGAFTVGAWFKTASTAITQTIFSSGNYTDGKVYGWYLRVNASNKVYFATAKGTGANQGTDFQIITGNTTVTDGNWHCVVATWNGSYYDIYLDGNSDATHVAWANALVYTTNYVRVGCHNNAGTDTGFFIGNLDNVFLINGTAWDATTIKSYMGSKIPADTTNLKLLLDFEGDILDSTANNHDGTLISAPYYSPDSAFDVNNRRSLDLESGSSQYAYCNDTASLSITGDISCEAWVKIEQLPSAVEFYIVAKYNYTNTKRNYAFAISGNKLEFIYSSNGDAGRVFLSDDDVVTSADVGKWVHVACSVDVSAQTCEMYKDGVLIADTASGASHTSIQDSDAPFSIGVRNIGGASPDGYFDGVIDEVRLWNDIRSEEEIQDNKDTQLVGNEAGLVGYWRLNGNYVDLTSNNNNLTPSGSPVFSHVVPFDGSVSSLIKKVSGVAYASIKKISGVAIASIKKVAGVE